LVNYFQAYTLDTKTRHEFSEAVIAQQAENLDSLLVSDNGGNMYRNADRVRQALAKTDPSRHPIDNIICERIIGHNLELRESEARGGSNSVIRSAPLDLSAS
jgi:hypothetical protein